MKGKELSLKVKLSIAGAVIIIIALSTFSFYMLSTKVTGSGGHPGEEYLSHDQGRTFKPWDVSFIVWNLVKVVVRGDISLDELTGVGFELTIAMIDGELTEDELSMVFRRLYSIGTINN